MNFFSPYEAAAWALIGHRIRITQAAAIKSRMAREMGQTLEIHAEAVHAFPEPRRLLQLESLPGLSSMKVERLRTLAAATLAGKLDAAKLRSAPAATALEERRTVPGIGPFSSQHMLRGAGEPDYLSLNEPRVPRAVALTHELDHEPSHDELASISEGWRPYRTWVTFLVRSMLEDETHEIARGRKDA